MRAFIAFALMLAAISAHAAPLRLGRVGNVWSVYSTFNEPVAGFELTFDWRGRPPVPEKGAALVPLATSEIGYNANYGPRVIKLIAIIIDPAECLAPGVEHEIVRFTGPGKMDWVLTIEYGNPDTSIVSCDGWEYPQTEADGPRRKLDGFSTWSAVKGLYR